MEYVLTGAVCVALLAGAFVLGRATQGKVWIALPVVIPIAFAIWGGVLHLTEDKSDCYEACGSAWALVFAVVSVIPALLLSGAIALGRASRPSEGDRSKRSQGLALE